MRVFHPDGVRTMSVGFPSHERIDTVVTSSGQRALIAGGGNERVIRRGASITGADSELETACKVSEARTSERKPQIITRMTFESQARALAARGLPSVVLTLTTRPIPTLPPSLPLPANVPEADGL